MAPSRPEARRGTERRYTKRERKRARPRRAPPPPPHGKLHDRVHDVAVVRAERLDAAGRPSRTPGTRRARRPWLHPLSSRSPPSSSSGIVGGAARRGGPWPARLRGLELRRRLLLRLGTQIFDLRLAEDDVRVRRRALEHVGVADREQDVLALLDRHARDVRARPSSRASAWPCGSSFPPGSAWRRRRRRRRPGREGWAGGGASSWSSRVCGGGASAVCVCVPTRASRRRLTDLASTAREGRRRAPAAGTRSGRGRGTAARQHGAGPRGARGCARGSGTGKHSPACPRSSRTSCHRPSPAPPPRSPPSLRNRLSVLVAVQRHVLSTSLASSSIAARARRRDLRPASLLTPKSPNTNCLLRIP